MIWLVAALLLFIFQIITILFHEFRHPSKTVAWLVILFILPIIGFVMYYFLAKEYTHRKKVRRRGLRYMIDPRHEGRRYAASQSKEEIPQIEGLCREPRLHALLNNIPSSSVTQQNEVKVLTNADMAYAAMLEAIEQAKCYVHFEFYTIRHDETGRQFQQLLIRKVQEGVKVRCIFDGVGSYKLENRFLNELRSAGVETYIFLPPLIAFFDKRMNYRNHRKIVVVDGVKGFLGGINIGDEYLGGNPDLGFWRDTHLELVGDAVYSLQYTFLTDWQFVSGKQLTDSILFPEHDNNTGSKRVQIISSGPDAHWDAILEMYFGAITTAKKRIFITTPYFVPDPSISMGLKTAAISGVDVKVIYPSRPDSKVVNYASLSYFEELLQAGVRFYSYEKGFMHAKVIIIDDILASVGTANMDMRSFFSNFEMNAVLFDKESIQRLEADFLQDLKDSKELKLEVFEKRSQMQKSKEVIARLLSPLF